MKFIRKFMIALTLFSAPIMLNAEPQRVYTVPIQLNAAAVTTESVVVVSTGVAVSGGLTAQTVLAANSNRLDYDIELTSCAVSTSKVWYAYDGTFILTTVTSNTAANWINFSSSDPGQRKFKKPDWVMPVGAIVAVTDGALNSCFLTVREWVTTSPIFQ